MPVLGRAARAGAGAAGAAGLTEAPATTVVLLVTEPHCAFTTMLPGLVPTFSVVVAIPLLFVVSAVSARLASEPGCDAIAI